MICNDLTLNDMLKDPLIRQMAAADGLSPRLLADLMTSEAARITDSDGGNAVIRMDRSRPHAQLLRRKEQKHSGNHRAT